MKITKRQLRRIVKEERQRLSEIGPPPDIDAPGWHPNDSQEWERSARYEERAEIEAEKKAFMKRNLGYWYNEFDPEDDGQADLIEDKISECYDAIYKELIDPYGG
jgi:hypothetical protein|tara:strand:+ start:206 stop:520 length:315 start_codon:yes stop_codon:yes gene_type:complete